MPVILKNLSRFALSACVFFVTAGAHAYEVVIDLGSSAGKDATIAMIDRSKWPFVADNSWGILYNQIPLYLLSQNQKTALLGNFRHKRAIVEIPYSDINGAPVYNASIEAFGYSTPFMLVLNDAEPDSMMTRAQIIALKAAYPTRTIIMNTRSWERDQAHVLSVQDVVDGVCIEYIPTNVPFNIKKHVAPFFEWAHNHNKFIMFLMPPQPSDHIGTRYVDGVKAAAQAIYDYNKNRLPAGWMASNKIFFMPANYTFGTSLIPYVAETSPNSILASAKALMDMRAQLDAGSGPEPDGLGWLPALQLLLD